MPPDKRLSQIQLDAIAHLTPPTADRPMSDREWCRANNVARQTFWDWEHKEYHKLFQEELARAREAYDKREAGDTFFETIVENKALEVLYDAMSNAESDAQRIAAAKEVRKRADAREKATVTATYTDRELPDLVSLFMGTKDPSPFERRVYRECIEILQAVPEGAFKDAAQEQSAAQEVQIGPEADQDAADLGGGDTESVIASREGVIDPAQVTENDTETLESDLEDDEEGLIERSWAQDEPEEGQEGPEEPFLEGEGVVEYLERTRPDPNVRMIRPPWMDETPSMPDSTELS